MKKPVAAFSSSLLIQIVSLQRCSHNYDGAFTVLTAAPPSNPLVQFFDSKTRCSVFRSSAKGVSFCFWVRSWHHGLDICLGARRPVFLRCFGVVLLLPPPKICFLQLFCRRRLLLGDSVGSTISFVGVKNRFLLVDGSWPVFMSVLCFVYYRYLLLWSALSFAMSLGGCRYGHFAMDWFVNPKGLFGYYRFELIPRSGFKCVIVKLVMLVFMRLIF